MERRPRSRPTGGITRRAQVELGGGAAGQRQPHRARSYRAGRHRGRPEERWPARSAPEEPTEERAALRCRGSLRAAPTTLKLARRRHVGLVELERLLELALGAAV